MATPTGDRPAQRDRLGPVRQGAKAEPRGRCGQGAPPNPLDAAKGVRTAAGRRHPAGAEAPAAVPPRALGLGRHPLPSDGAGRALGTCLPVTCTGRSRTWARAYEIHGHEHGNLLRPVAFALGGGTPQRRIDRRRRAGRPRCPMTNAELGFNGWPTFDEIIHIKTHQDLDLSRLRRWPAADGRAHRAQPDARRDLDGDQADLRGPERPRHVEPRSRCCASSSPTTRIGAGWRRPSTTPGN